MSREAERVLEEARRICAVPAPPFGEAARGRLVAALFAEAGAPARIDATGNVIAELGGSGPETTVFAAHLDTVFPAGTPIAFAQGDGRLAAPGLGDNSIAIAALLHLARRLAGRELRRPVALVATVGEEGLGDLRGARALLDELACSAFVAVEGLTLQAIKVTGVGSVRFGATVIGPGGHPWIDRGTPSAVHGLAECLAAAVREARAAGVVINAGVIEGGTAINTIASEASAEIDLRAEDDDLLRAAARRVRAALEAVEEGLETTVEALGRRPAGAIALDHPLLEAARRARSRAGLPPAREDAASTDANAAYGRGIPAITVGVTTGGNAHRLDEYIDLAPIPAGLAALAALAEDVSRASGDAPAG
ncbi:MAG TPA: M20/M25/M40 family metallo-hydrolase [Solirubrobacteraceae bacterium]|nr:M20/M25/M40 family metallo-hydrolase [Solirubrobacteraceae bacterium]